jgi:hypothetical protein
MRPEEKLNSLCIVLSPTPQSWATYVPSRIDRNLLYLSEQGPMRTEGSYNVGRLGRDASIGQAYQHACLTGLRLAAVAKAALGELDQSER